MRSFVVYILICSSFFIYLSARTLSFSILRGTLCRHRTKTRSTGQNGQRTPRNCFPALPAQQRASKYPKSATRGWVAVRMSHRLVLRPPLRNISILGGNWWRFCEFVHNFDMLASGGPSRRAPFQRGPPGPVPGVGRATCLQRSRCCGILNLIAQTEAYVRPIVNWPRPRTHDAPTPQVASRSQKAVWPEVGSLPVPFLPRIRPPSPLRVPFPVLRRPKVNKHWLGN